MIHTISVYNATLEDFRTQFNSTGVRFKARGITKVPEDCEEPIKTQYAKRGLVVVRPGDDLKSKEREALINYLGFINERIGYFNLYLDEKKRNGVTIEAPRDLQKLKQWKDEIIGKLELDGALEPIPSFNEALPADAKSLFAGDVVVKDIEEIVKKSPRKAKSFKEVNIEDEIA